MIKPKQNYLEISSILVQVYKQLCICKLLIKNSLSFFFLKVHLGLFQKKICFFFTILCNCFYKIKISLKLFFSFYYQVKRSFVAAPCTEMYAWMMMLIFRRKHYSLKYEQQHHHADETSSVEYFTFVAHNNNRQSSCGMEKYIYIFLF